MREITTHHVEGAAATRVFVLDEPDSNAGGMCHNYAASWEFDDGRPWLDPMRQGRGHEPEGAG